MIYPVRNVSNNNVSKLCMDYFEMTLELVFSDRLIGTLQPFSNFAESALVVRGGKVEAKVTT